VKTVPALLEMPPIVAFRTQRLEWRYPRRKMHIRIKPRSLGTAVLAGILWISLGLAGQAQNTAMLQGTVRDAAGHPVAGATVQFQASAKKEAQTDPQGNYRLPVPPGSGYTLHAEKSGIGEATFGPFALGARETKTIDLKLSPKGPAAEFYD